MAGPSVVVRFLGDLKQLSSSITGAGDKAQTVGTRAHAAFSSMLGTLNKSGVLGPFSGALDALDQTFGVLVDHAKSIGTTMMGVGGGVLALGATLSAFGSKEKASHQQLQAAVEATGHSYDNYADGIEKAVKQQENYGHTSAQTQDALAKLTEATHDPQKAIELLGTVSNVAAAKHEDLGTAAGQVAKVYNGNTRLLKEFGVTIDKATGKTADNKTALQKLAEITAGQASAATDTFAGKLDKIKTKLEDQVSMIGQKYGPTLQIAGTAVMALGSIWEVAGPIIAGNEDLTLWPILLIAVGIAALVVALYELYKHWNTVFAFCKAIVMDVWNWIKNNWPLLVGFLLGPIGIAAALIITHFDTIKNFADSVWHHIVDGFTWLWGEIRRIAGDMFSPIESAFKAVANGVAHAWNSTIGAIHFSIPSWVPGVGGKGFDMPNMPTLAQGGLITSTGFVFAHAGEAISPIPNGLGGPAVHIENVHLSQELDVDSFSRRMAWNLQKQAV